MTRLRNGRMFWNSNPGRWNIFSSRQKRPNRRYCLMGTEILSRGYSGRSVKLTNYFHITPRLSTSGATPRICFHSVERDNFNVYIILSFGQLPIADNNNHLNVQGLHVWLHKKTGKEKSVEWIILKNKHLLVNVTSKPPQHIVTIMVYETSYLQK
jgi:hypothetical protein